MTIEQIYKQIKVQRYTWCKIMQNNNTVLNLVSNNEFQYTPEEIERCIKEYVNEFPGTYKFQFKRRSTDRNDNIVTFSNVNVNDHTTGVTILSSGHSGLSHDQMYQKVKEDLLKELTTQKRELDIKEKESFIKAREKELETVSGKAMHMLMSMVGAWQAKNNPVGALGSTVNASEQNNDTAQITYHNDAVPFEQRTADDLQKITMAINLLLTVMSPDTLSQVALKLAQNPTMVNQVKMFL